MGDRGEDVSLVTVSAVALFRYQVVSQVFARELRGHKRSEAVVVTCSMPHPSPDRRPRNVKVRTLYRWLSAFEQRGISGLEPKGRKKTDVSEVLDEAFVAFLRAEKSDDPRASIPELIRRAKERKLIASEDEVSRTTVWRAVTRMGLPTRIRPSKAEGDMHRFAYPNRMMMILCDGKHFRAGVDRARRVALFFLDDAETPVTPLTAGPPVGVEGSKWRRQRR
jgi:transposase